MQGSDARGYALRLRAIVGGNWNNDLQAGPFYVNLNNAPSNSNSNIGVAQSYPTHGNMFLDF